MKTLPSILAVLCAFTVAAAAEDLRSKTDKTGDAELRKQEQAAKAVYTVREPNRIDRNGITYRGTVPQAIKSRNPLQLINPFAPMEHGNGSQNLSTSLPGETPKVICVSVGF